MEDKFAQFQSDIKQGQEEATAKAQKKAHYKKLYVHVSSVVHKWPQHGQNGHEVVNTCILYKL